MKIRAGASKIHALGAAGIALFILFKLIPTGSSPLRETMVKAAEIMAGAVRAVRACREAKGMSPDPSTDVNLTGLIGIERSPITTTLGNLEAKRTTTDPNFAGLVVRLLVEAGVGQGDVIAVGASGSFPALVVAVLSAAQAMNVEPILVYSLGASQWGANDPAFDGLDILECLARGPGPRGRVVALAVGGDEDRGAELSLLGRQIIEDRMLRSGLPVIDEPDLQSNVAARVRLYLEGAAGRRIGAFVNIGGSWANIGTDASVLRIPPGLARVTDIPPAGGRGVLQQMAARGVPVVHLLNIKGLAAAEGLPWDPSPLPKPGVGEVYTRRVRRAVLSAAFGAFYAVLTAFVLVPRRRGRR